MPWLGEHRSSLASRRDPKSSLPMMPRSSPPRRSCSFFVRSGRACSPGGEREPAVSLTVVGFAAAPQVIPIAVACLRAQSHSGRPEVRQPGGCGESSRATVHAAPACSLVAAFFLGHVAQLCRCMTRNSSAICKHVHAISTCGSKPVGSSSASTGTAAFLTRIESTRPEMEVAVPAIACALVKTFHGVPLIRRSGEDN